MSKVELTDGLDMAQYTTDCDTALAYMFMAASYCTTQQVDDILTAYTIAVNEMVTGVEDDRQDKVDGAADVMRHTKQVAMFYMEGTLNESEYTYAVKIADLIVGELDVSELMEFMYNRAGWSGEAA